MKNSSTGFRLDINGLRAVAVIAVVLYHFNSSWLPGGFAGVDVFFVISGFLMTSIIFRGIEGGNFSIYRFLVARAKRIVPALVAVVTLLLVIGYLALEPLTYQQVGKHSLGSITFLSNFIYMFESGYFDADSKSKFLLHTWSLSVEWQFYFVYPIVLFSLSKAFSVNRLKDIVMISFCAIFILCIYTTNQNPTASYYMIYSRAWEMLLGGMAYCFTWNASRSKSTAAYYVGLTLILISVLFIDDKTPWPGYMAMLPAIGAFMVISANAQSGVLSLRPFQAIGTGSYSMYLMHWPVLVFAAKFGASMPFLVYAAITATLTFVLYKTIESKRNYGYRTLATYCVVSAASFLVSINGLNYRVSDEYKLSAAEFHGKYYGGHDIPQEGKPFIHNMKPGEAPDLIVSGDSFSRQYANYFLNHKYKFVSVMKDGCFSTPNYIYLLKGKPYANGECDNRLKNFISEMAKYPKADVVYTMSWNSYMLTDRKSGKEVSSMNNGVVKEEVRHIIELAGKDRKLILIGTANGTTTSAFECLAKHDLPLGRVVSNCGEREARKTIPVNETLKKLAEQYDNVAFIDPNDALCSDGMCRVLTDDRQPVYSDNSHLSVGGAEIVGKYISKSL